MLKQNCIGIRRSYMKTYKFKAFMLTLSDVFMLQKGLVRHFVFVDTRDISSVKSVKNRRILTLELDA